MKLKSNNHIKIAIYNSVSAILIVLFWFILYYFFENHGWLCSSKEECLHIHQHISFHTILSTISFIIFYLLFNYGNHV